MAMAMALNNVTRLFHTFMASDSAGGYGEAEQPDDGGLSTRARSPLNNSTTLAQVLVKEASERLNAYQDAGYRHCHTDHAVLVKLDNALKFLQNHVQRARVVMEEIQKVLDEADGIMHNNLNAQLGNFALTEDDVGVSETAQTSQGVHMGEAFSPNIKRRHLSTPDYVTTMAAIYNMLQQDFTMQVSQNPFNFHQRSPN